MNAETIGESFSTVSCQGRCSLRQALEKVEPLYTNISSQRLPDTSATRPDRVSSPHEHPA
jgi:hypothetical protein